MRNETVQEEVTVMVSIEFRNRNGLLPWVRTDYWILPPSGELDEGDLVSKGVEMACQMPHVRLAGFSRRDIKSAQWWIFRGRPLRTGGMKV